MPPTIFTSRISDIISFVKKNKLSIIKPINGHGGNNIKLLNISYSSKIFEFNKIPTIGIKRLIEKISKTRLKAVKIYKKIIFL